ncbi:MAG: DUF1499 domain-containing protein [Gammaproteobacteria bacterium]|nr:DUF1499 domain-containing protein [Gammaproteobacteria bacterium]
MKLPISVILVLPALLLGGLLLAAGALLLNRLPWDQPPGTAARLAAYLGGNSAATDPASDFPELRPPRYDIPPEALHAAVVRAVERLGWETSGRDDGKLLLAAVVITPLLRFRDDVVIRAERAPGGGSLLTARSASRVGRADFGANTRHLLDLFAAVDGIVAGNAGDRAG